MDLPTLSQPQGKITALTMFSEDTYLYFSPDIVISPFFDHKGLENRDKEDVVHMYNGISSSV